MQIPASDLDKIWLFQGINPFARKFLSEYIKVVTLPRGQRVMYAGEQPDHCYFLLDGLVHIRNQEFVYVDEPEANARENGAASRHSRQELRVAKERHQGFRGIGDSIGIAAMLSRYAGGEAADSMLSLPATRIEAQRQAYEQFLGVGQNTANTYAVTECEALVCSRDVLLTAIQICPVLVCNIARSLSLRMQQDTLLQQSAARTGLECVPVLAQFFFEWHLVKTAYRKLGSGRQAVLDYLPRDDIMAWLRITDGKAIGRAIRLLEGDADAVNAICQVTGVSDAEARARKAIQEGDRDIRVINAEALLNWCQETQSRALLKAMPASESRMKRTPHDGAFSSS